MADDFLKNYRGDFFNLLEGGFIAVNTADEDSAIKLFKAAELLRPESTFPKVGFGYMHMCKLELKQAIKEFEDVLHKEPNNEMAKAFLAICMSMTPTQTAKGEEILEEMCKKADDPEVQKLADVAIDFVDKFIKKAPSPVAPQTKKNKKTNK